MWIDGAKQKPEVAGVSEREMSSGELWHGSMVMDVSVEIDTSKNELTRFERVRIVRYWQEIGRDAGSTFSIGEYRVQLAWASFGKARVFL